jgi:hypothetical protein
MSLDNSDVRRWCALRPFCFKTALGAGDKCGNPVNWFDYELGEKEFYKGFVCEPHRVLSGLRSWCSLEEELSLGIEGKIGHLYTVLPAVILELSTVIHVLFP